MAFRLPFEIDIADLDDRLAALPGDSPEYADTLKTLQALEKKVYPNLSTYELFLLSGHPERPKASDYIRSIFHDIQLYTNPSVRGDHLVIAGEAMIDLNGRFQKVIVVGQQTGPSSQRAELLTLPVSEYRRWNQGMGFPDGYRKATYAMHVAEQNGWPVVVFVDTPGADPSEYSEEEGQAFAINEVIHRTTSLKVPNLSYIISLGASGGAIALTATNRTIINQYATYMVISPGGCASILYRNRSAESITKAAEELCLTSAHALEQGTVDEVIEEGFHPGHRYPGELLDAAREALKRNLSEILQLPQEEVESARREKFYAMGKWGTTDDSPEQDKLARLAADQDREFEDLREAVVTYIAEETNGYHHNGKTGSEAEDPTLTRGRFNVASMLYAIEQHDAAYLTEVLGRNADMLSPIQWEQIQEYALQRRYGNLKGALSLDPNDEHTYRRLHPVDWIRLLTDPNSYHEFEETIAYCSIPQLHFPKYEENLQRGIEKTGLHSGIITGRAKIRNHPVVLAINNFGLVGSSLCDEIGEKFHFAAHQARQTSTPLIVVAMGGGARMQEGTPSMHRNIPKAQHALNELSSAGIPHISVIADPTLGGTAISYGLRGDYMIVVTGSANIGFSGKRVVEQFQQRKVARDFQHGGWLLNRGFVDEQVATHNLAEYLAELLTNVEQGKKLADIQKRSPRFWCPKEVVALDPMQEEPVLA